jgi:hypothetical protein
MSHTNLPLPVFYAQTLRSLLPVFDDTLSLSDTAAQSILAAGLNDLHLIGRMLSSLSIFSDNETIDELGDGEMVFMTLGWVVGEAESKSGNGGMDERKAALQRSEVRRCRRPLPPAASARQNLKLTSQAAFSMFLGLLTMYKVLQPEEEAESSAMAGEGGLPRDPAKRREAKIAQYKREKELRQLIAVSPLVV